jgi:alpha-aminoadipate/glutamate carrier protein LysW
MNELAVTCPECETSFSIPDLPPGETLGCPECLLTLRINRIDDGKADLEMVDVELKDWGQ